MVFFFFNHYFYKMQTQSSYEKLKHQVLQELWGYDHFRDLQEEIIDSVINGKDSVALLPTGGGKSMCYQIPAILLEGTCIVISPLLALMKEQVEELRSMGIEAERLSSELNDLEEDEVFANCKEGLTKILYVSPERLMNRKFINQALEIKFSFIAVDEAHCISEWGQDFRPSYQNIKTFRENFVTIPCLALTATATPKVLEEIKSKLNLKNPNVFTKGFRRTNIQLNIIDISDKYQFIYNFLNLNRASGLIYTNTRKEAEELSNFLHSKGIKNVDYYHAGLHSETKNRKQKWWQISNFNVLITTNAFGMGINKENVRFVIHLNPPQSLENYYQEIGRAGRDGEESSAYLLWNQQDLDKTNEILKRQTPNKKEYEKAINYTYGLFQIAEFEEIDKEFQFNVLRVQKITGVQISKIKAVLEFMHQQELIYLNKNKNQSSLELLIPFDGIENLPKSDAYFLELLQRAITGFTSHKVHFNEEQICGKLQLSSTLFKERLKELQKREYLDYIDGSISSIKFTKPRNDISLYNEYWKLFKTIQENKIRKWEEFKFFITDQSYCKMKLILHYFGEKDSKICNNCSICNQTKPQILKNTLSINHSNILNALKKRASTLDEICIMIGNTDRDQVLEDLVTLLDDGKIKMLNFRTYTIA